MESRIACVGSVDGFVGLKHAAISFGVYRI